MRVEVALRVRSGALNNETHQFHDGMPVAWWPPGQSFTPAEMVTFFASGDLPAGFVAIPHLKRANLARALRRMRYLTSGVTAEEAAEHLLNDDEIRDGKQVRDKATNEIKFLFKNYTRKAEAKIVVAEREKPILVAEGLDSNWGHMDLKVHGIVTLDILTLGDLAEMVEAPSDTGSHPMRKRLMTRKRRWLFPYRTLLSAKTVADFNTPGVRVDVNRAVTAVDWNTLRKVVSGA